MTVREELDGWIAVPGALGCAYASLAIVAAIYGPQSWVQLIMGAGVSFFLVAGRFAWRAHSAKAPVP